MSYHKNLIFKYIFQNCHSKKFNFMLWINNFNPFRWYYKLNDTCLYYLAGKLFLLRILMTYICFVSLRFFIGRKCETKSSQTTVAIEFIFDTRKLQSKKRDYRVQDLFTNFVVPIELFVPYLNAPLNKHAIVRPKNPGKNMNLSSI